MDGDHFDELIRSLNASPPRRALLGGLAASVLGLFAHRVPVIEAKKKRKSERKRKSRKAKPNAFGCIDVGKACESGKDCCSGICAGKKGKKQCCAHDTGGCQAGQSPVICGGMENIGCLTSRGGFGACQTNTGNAGYCAAQVEDCVACATDRECEALFGLTAACVLCPAQCAATGGRACAVFTP